MVLQPGRLQCRSALGDTGTAGSCALLAQVMRLVAIQLHAEPKELADIRKLLPGINERLCKSTHVQKLPWDQALCQKKFREDCEEILKPSPQLGSCKGSCTGNALFRGCLSRPGRCLRSGPCTDAY